MPELRLQKLMKIAFVRSTIAVFILTLFVLQSAQSAAAGEAVPLFELNSVYGKPVALESLRGKVVMINFWATWCTPCVTELPTMAALKESFSDRPFEILAINMSEGADQIRRFLSNNNIDLNFPLLLDPAGIIAEEYEVKALPATLIINRHGNFEFGGVGGRDWNEPAVRAELLPLFEAIQASN
ncbi:MAG: peroxiredoxin [Gammaproteobacteria bacterium]|jgi:peroxiredoxin